MIGFMMLQAVFISLFAIPIIVDLSRGYSHPVPIFTLLLHLDSSNLHSSFNNSYQHTPRRVKWTR